MILKNFFQQQLAITDVIGRYSLGYESVGELRYARVYVESDLNHKPKDGTPGLIASNMASSTFTSWQYTFACVESRTRRLGLHEAAPITLMRASQADSRSGNVHSLHVAPSRCSAWVFHLSQAASRRLCIRGTERGLEVGPSRQRQEPVCASGRRDRCQDRRSCSRARN